MDTYLLSRFSNACGAVRPLELLVERPNGTIAKTLTLQQPFAIIGSDPRCDFALPGSELAPRHVLLQVVHGRLFAFDLSGRVHGMIIGGVPRTDSWLNSNESMTCSGFRITLTNPIALPQHLPNAFTPLVPNAHVIGQLPQASIEFRNGRTAQNKWPINRAMTMVGRSKSCKINLTSEDIDPFHCYFLLTTDGVWVVDLLSRNGITVNGLPQRLTRLLSADEVAVARFRIGIDYPMGEPQDPIVQLSSVELGKGVVPNWERVATPVPDSNASPIFGKIKTPPPQPSSNDSVVNFNTAPVKADGAKQAATDTPNDLKENHDLAVPAFSANGQGNLAVTGQMFEQFQQSMLMMMKMFGQMHQQQMAGIQQEMARLATVTEEIGKMQGQIANAVNPVDEPHYNPLPSPEELPTVNEETAEQHQHMYDKMAQLEAERQTIWKKLSNIFSPAATGA